MQCGLIPDVEGKKKENRGNEFLALFLVSHSDKKRLSAVQYRYSNKAVPCRTRDDSELSLSNSVQCTMTMSNIEREYNDISWIWVTIAATAKSISENITGIFDAENKKADGMELSREKGKGLPAAAAVLLSGSISYRNFS